MKIEYVATKNVVYNERISVPNNVFEIMQKIIGKKTKQEHFVVFELNGAHFVEKVNIVSIGILNKTLVHPREVFRSAIISGASAIIVSHNHPSGDLEPSPEDKDITRRLKEAGEVLGIKLLDHVIVSGKSFISFNERGII